MTVFNNCRVTAATRNGVRLASFTVSVEAHAVDTQDRRLNRLVDQVFNRLVQKYGRDAYYFHNRYHTPAAPGYALKTEAEVDRALPAA